MKIDSKPVRGASEGHNDELNSVITCSSKQSLFHHYCRYADFSQLIVERVWCFACQ